MQVQPNPESPTSRRLSQIDGLLAGFNVLASDCPIDRQKQPWVRLEELRGDMQRQWEHLRDVPLAVDDLEGFCETALFAYRNALAGLVPVDLPKVVGLCSLSYAVSRILERDGTSPSETFLDDVQVCLKSVEMEEDRQMIEVVMAKTWPVQADQDSHVGSGTMATHQDQDWAYYPSSHASTYPSATSSEPWQIQATSCLPYSSTASGFGGLVGGLPVSANWAQTTQRPFEQFDAAVDTADYLPLSLIPIPSAPWPGPDQVGLQVGSYGQLEATSQQTAVSSAPSDRPQHLQDTELFKAIGSFLDGSSDFLVLLSGNGVTAKNLDSCLSSNQERSTDKECLQSLYMDPLLKRQEFSQAPCSTILSITKKFVGYGFLQSVDEAQSYMTAVAKECRCSAPTKKGSVKCPDCNKIFPRKWNMKRHQKKNQCPASRAAGGR
ncbi:uncharacterized protein NECHADRAFT_75647 [Fusarium vanettenii 77-13-4]|uniref:C2H2-type domain-containing protein n=1 Tax=Fusarium vanettenii (strain ATCC MYA-4622 / CBS 123669 / FGSC 9596 / NRRL 45880 / 77-13-4) TaxID=660122 RepID=C7YJE2_FUSV7|nr:uncharacterized protein NECHADRAFT_75647 [Fusarium vanettenii 77-13-4]EEU48258.1 hypothetical protein NECHADRAFT_75647 [Fusarium vanettenii 77-13-4]